MDDFLMALEVILLIIFIIIIAVFSHSILSQIVEKELVIKVLVIPGIVGGVLAAANPLFGIVPAVIVGMIIFGAMIWHIRGGVVDNEAAKAIHRENIEKAKKEGREQARLVAASWCTACMGSGKNANGCLCVTCGGSGKKRI